MFLNLMTMYLFISSVKKIDVLKRYMNFKIIYVVNFDTITDNLGHLINED